MEYKENELKRALQDAMNLWSELAETGGSKTDCIQSMPVIGRCIHLCPICEYTRCFDDKQNTVCEKCPVDWHGVDVMTVMSKELTLSEFEEFEEFVDEVDMYVSEDDAPCESIGSPFVYWANAEEPEMKILAGIICELIKEAMDKII
jgi:hypothetical protein